MKKFLIALVLLSVLATFLMADVASIRNNANKPTITQNPAFTLKNGTSSSEAQILPMNNTTRTPAGIPFLETFNGLTVLPAGWTCSSWANWNVYYQQQGIGGSTCVTLNAYGSLRWVQTTSIGPIQADSELKFWYHVALWNSTGTGVPALFGGQSLQVLVNGDLVRTINEANGHTLQTAGAYTEITIDLSAYVGEMVNIRFSTPAGPSTPDLEIRLDDIEVTGSPLEYDLAALAITGSASPSVGRPANYTINVKNVGSENIAANGYTVRLRQVGNATPLATVNGLAINSDATVLHTISWTPTTVGPAQLYGEIVYLEDENINNNITTNLNVTIWPADVIVSTIGNWDSTTGTYVAPLNYLYEAGLSQTVYLASEILNSGMITHITYNFLSAGNIPPNIPVELWMAQTTATDVSSWIDPSQTNFDLVFSGSLNLSTPGLGTLEIELDTPFFYDGIDNLVIMGHRTLTANWYDDNMFQVTSGLPNRTIAAFEDGIAFDPEIVPDFGEVLGGPGDYIPNIRIAFSEAEVGHITGTVTAGTDAVSGVRVTINELGRWTTTNELGVYTLGNVPVGTYGLTATKLGYTNGTAPGVIVTEDETTTQNLQITALGTIEVTGLVKDGVTNEPVADAAVSLLGYDSYSATTDATGLFTITGVYVSNVYELRIVKSGYLVYVDENVEVGLINLTLEPILMVPRIVEFSQGFEDTQFPPTGWFLGPNNAQGRNWMKNLTLNPNPAGIAANTGTGCAISESWHNDVVISANNYLVSPYITLPPNATGVTLSWFIATQDRDYPVETYSIYITTEELTPIGTTVPITAFEGSTSIFSETLGQANFTWQQRTIDITKFAGQSFHLAWRHHNAVDQFIIKLDDIELVYGLSPDEISDSDKIVVKKSSLAANYPNPFNPTTTISFDLAVSGHVSIDVFNIRGQKVTTLVNDEFNAGPHTVNWNGVDSNGRSVSSGIYFYRMTTDDFTSTRKMILMK
jgi:archaellum component FlaG (FlaF/FlaG flagellin family)